jgi:hypothetical protein
LKEGFASCRPNQKGHEEKQGDGLIQFCGKKDSSLKNIINFELC